MTLPWYPRDMGKYARDTKHLTMLEHGAYNLLLDYYYSTGGLPDASGASSNASSPALPMVEHSRIYRVCGAMSKDEQMAVDAVLKFFFKLDKKGNYSHRKADEVIDKQQEIHNSRVEAGRKGGLKRSSSGASSKAKAKPKQEEKEKEINPPTPQRGQKFSEEEIKGYDVMRLISVRGEDNLQASAPGWDKQHLAGIYNEKIRTGEFEPPRIPDLAFPEWCKKYTKGKRP
jgi:uncharacterized protein YdaU (DUF1376 family)